MKIERTKNAARNIFFLTVQRFQQTLLPFCAKTVMIYFMGIQYLGLNSLFSSILQVLNLAELGVGSAMVYSMYKPIAEDDTKTICALLQLYKIYYRIIGLIIAVGGLILLPFIPMLVKKDLPSDLNIYILYLLNLGVTVLSYWLWAYKGSLLNAHQRDDILSKVLFATTTIQYLLQIVVIIFYKNYYYYLVIALITQVATNIVTAMVSSKMFPEYKASGKLDSKIAKNVNQKIQDLFTLKVGNVVIGTADSIVISAFLGLTVLAIYQNYYYIMNTIILFVGIIFTSCTGGIGNSLVTESKEKNFNDFCKFSFILIWIIGICTCCLLGLYQPFMEIWVGRNYLLENSGMVFFCIYFLVYELNQMLSLYKDAGGIWHEDRLRPLITGIINLLLNLLLVQYWGIYGILLATILSMSLVGIPWILHNLFNTLFKKRYLKFYIQKIIRYLLTIILCCVITYLICQLMPENTWVFFLIRILICVSVPNVIMYLFFKNTDEFMYSCELLSRITEGNRVFNHIVQIIIRKNKD